MASKKFAHWNGLPFMTAPRTKYYSAQLQSPFFRLPREIRDVIYGYYVLGEDGHQYDSETGKMLYQSPELRPKQFVPLGLMITCRIAVGELQHQPFKKVHFHTHLSLNDGRAYMGLCSRAGRFKVLLLYVERLKRKILINVAGLLQHDDFVDLYTHFPSVKGWFSAPLRQSVQEREDKLVDSETAGEDIACQAFSDALQHALELAKKRNPPEFAKLACEMFGIGRSPISAYKYLCTDFNYFIKGALYDVFTWHPKPWSMPSDDELGRLEALICQPGDIDTQLPITDEGNFYLPDIALHLNAANERWFFSATSITVNFLQGLTKERRQNMRTIIIHENFKSVSRPECHARGLIPFCIENPELRVERHIGLFSNLLPRGFRWWESCNRSEWLRSSVCFSVIIPWFEEALSLVSHGMPADSFALILDGTNKESLEIWGLLKYAAATQEARLRQLQLNETSPPARPLSSSITNQVWGLPAGFAKIIRDIMKGDSIIQFNGDVGELWDPHLFFFERKDWTDMDWWTDWRKNVDGHEIRTDFFRRAAQRYHIQPVPLSTTYQVIRSGKSGKSKLEDA